MVKTTRDDDDDDLTMGNPQPSPKHSRKLGDTLGLMRAQINIKAVQATTRARHSTLDEAVLTRVILLRGFYDKVIRIAARCIVAEMRDVRVAIFRNRL